MRLEFNITSFSEHPGTRELVLHTEGRLRVLVGSTLVFDAEGILVVELAVVLRKWLDALGSGPANLYYASMDFEEEPILALRHDAATGAFQLESVWATAPVPQVGLDEAVWAAKKYLSQLRRELGEAHASELEEALAAATGEPNVE